MRLLEELEPRFKKARELSSFGRLEEVYSALPPTQCDMCGECCRQGPEIYYVEFLYTLQHLLSFPPEKYRLVIQRAVKFYLLGLADASLTCPFLEDDKCTIYAVRWFVCRWWGLEAEADFLRHHHRERRDLARQELLRQLELAYQIKLPPAASDAAHLPFCRQVEITEGEHPSQSRKRALLGKIIQLDQELLPLGTMMQQMNYRDFSAHLCSLFLSPQEMVEYRLLALKEFLAQGFSRTAETLTSKLAQVSIPLNLSP
jgi:Fe-S-cluster containining protein